MNGSVADFALVGEPGINPKVTLSGGTVKEAVFAMISEHWYDLPCAPHLRRSFPCQLTAITNQTGEAGQGTNERGSMRPIDRADKHVTARSRDQGPRCCLE